jgi:formylglycine-generating enzyme required for sulfatase activity
MDYAKTKLSICIVALSLVVLRSGVVQAAFVTVGNPGNPADTEIMNDGTTGYGSVGYTYQISTTEVSNAEYTAFLNAVAVTDDNSLYNVNMAGTLGGITQSGLSGSFTYATVAGRENNPVVFVSFYDALRYANWLHNGQPSGLQDSSTTEDGAYTITADGITDNSITRNAGAQFFLTSEDEWYKAAYYDPATASYFDYATSSNTVPTAEAPPGGSNSANYDSFVGNTTAVHAYTNSVSPYGTFDQSGNVFEWNESIIAGRFRGFRGGAWGSGALGLPASARGVGDPASEFDVGFRVARLASPSVVPETSSFLVWGLGLALMLCGRRWAGAH